MLLSWTSFLLLQLYISSVVKGVRHFDIRFHNLTFDTVSPKIEICTAEIIDYHGIPAINALMLHRKSVQQVDGEILIDIFDHKGKMYHVYDVKLDICKALKESPRNHFAALLYNEMAKFGHPPRSCPFEANVTYYVENFYLIPEQLPPYTPEVTFIMYLKIYYEKKLAGSAALVGAVESKRKKSLTIQKKSTKET